MDCRTARILLDYARPLTTELEAGEAEALGCHLADCPECGSMARAERLADDHLGRAIRAVPVPVALRDRLVLRLKAERSRQNQRRLVRWLGGLAAAAAACFLLVWIGLQNQAPARLDPQLAGNEFVLDTFNPTLDSVEEGFKRKGINAVPPPDFNYALLTYYDIKEFQGKRVPFLLFTKDKVQARVYILSAKQFDLKQALANPQDLSSQCQVEIRRHPQRADIVYLVICTSNSLGTFLSEDQRQVG